MLVLSVFVDIVMAAPCEPDVAVTNALVAVLQEDVEAARQSLAEAVEAWACSGVADRQALGRYWLIDGATGWLAGESMAANDAFAAARNVSPNVWLSDLSPEVREIYLSAQPPEGRGALLFNPPLGVREVWVDGAQLVGPAEVGAGAHLVQVGDGFGQVVFAEHVWVGPSVSVRVQTGLPPIEAKDLIDPVVPMSPDSFETDPPHLVVQVLTGVGVAFGEELQSEEATEPATRFTVPLELGVGLRSERFLGRLHVGTRWLANGRFLGAADDRTIAPRFGADLSASAAGVFGLGHAGVLAGAQWPGRLAVRAVSGVLVADGFVAEARAGLNVPTDRGVEAAVSVHLGAEFQ